MYILYTYIYLCVCIYGIPLYWGFALCGNFVNFAMFHLLLLAKGVCAHPCRYVLNHGSLLRQIVESLQEN